MNKRLNKPISILPIARVTRIRLTRIPNNLRGSALGDLILGWAIHQLPSRWYLLEHVGRTWTGKVSVGQNSRLFGAWVRRDCRDWGVYGVSVLQFGYRGGYGRGDF